MSMFSAALHNLVADLLQHVICAGADGDRELLTRMIRADDPQVVADEIGNLTAYEFARLVQLVARTPTRVLRIAVDSHTLRELIPRVRTEAATRRRQDDFLRGGATLPMMRALFGCSTAQVQARRRQLGLISAGGRPCAPTVVDELSLAHAWAKYDGLPLVDQVYAVHLATGISIPIIWEYYRAG